MKVPWIAKAEIENLATMILEDYAAVFKRTSGPPVPVEDIIERYFDLRIAFVDFEKRCGQTDVLGAIYLSRRLIGVNANLDRPACEGRLNFTFAHEAGHWVLHRRLVRDTDPVEDNNPLVLCRTRDAASQIEWQANYFAACFLMPQACIQAAFESAVGCRPLRLVNETARLAGCCTIEPCVAHWPQIAGAVRRAGRFSNVSKQAIIIRLENLGLVVNETPLPMNWASVRELSLTA